MEAAFGGTKRMVVNEFENVEATYYASRDPTGCKTNEVGVLLQCYWENQINELLLCHAD